MLQMNEEFAVVDILTVGVTSLSPSTFLAKH